MLTSVTKRSRWGLVLGGLAIATCALAAPTPAKAYGWHGGWYGPRIGIGFGYYPWGYAYAPPAPVYYAPPPVYYPPTYYSGYSSYYYPAGVPSSTVVHRTVHHVHHAVHHSTASCTAPTP